MKRDDRLQPPVELVGPAVRIHYPEQDDPRAELDVERWLRSLLDSLDTPEEGRRP